MICFVFRLILLLIIIIINLFTAHAENINYDYSQDKGLNINFPNLGKLKIGTDIACGYLRDGALYASFGLEGQIYQCSKLVFNFDGTTEDENLFFKLDVAPLYDSVKTIEKNNGILENILAIKDNGVLTRRYWIEL